MSGSSIGPRFTLSVVLAFLAVYILWGSTYFAIRVAVREMPPLFAAGLRFATAGLILYVWQVASGVRQPDRRQWRNLLILGALMFLFTYSALFWAETRIDSGVASVLVAMLPIWTVLFESFIFRSVRITWDLGVAIALGFIGVTVLVSGSLGAGAWSITACVLILVSEISWSLGSIISKRMSLPKSGPLTAGIQMMSGGVYLLIFSVAAGELRALPHPSLRGWAALLYLILAGSLLAYTAYVFLLGQMSATAVSSYAYVNPLVALLIGWWLGGESLGPRTLLGSALVIGSVLFTLRSTSNDHERLRVSTRSAEEPASSHHRGQ